MEKGIDSNVLQPHVRIMSDIPRWAIIRTIKQQNLADHQYYTAIYAAYIARIMELDQTQFNYIITKALTHDFDEMISGDIPSPAKKNMNLDDQPKYQNMLSAPKAMALSIVTAEPDNKGLCDDVVRVADLFEALMFLADEFDLGNVLAGDLMEELGPELVGYGNTLKHNLGIELLREVRRLPRRRIPNRIGLKS